MTDSEGQMWLDDRIMKIQSVIGEYGEDQFYLSFSGGKDSTVLHHLLDEAIPGNRIPRVYCNTGIEYVEMVKHVKSLRAQDDRIVMINPGINIQKMLREKGYPFKSKEHAECLASYQHGGKGKWVSDYLNDTGRYGCPKKLKYQFSEGFTVPISDKCCWYIKEKPLHDWAKDHGKTWAILGLMQEEGGRRRSAKCLQDNTRNRKPNSFSPLAVMTSDWEDWYIQSRQIRLCKLYCPPYSFERTGCKGCPFNIHLQHDLDVLAQYFPGERKQCELIWKPVYDEYRRLGYRLRKDDGQLSLFD